MFIEEQGKGKVRRQMPKKLKETLPVPQWIVNRKPTLMQVVRT